MPSFMSVASPDQLDGTADLESLSQRHLGDSGDDVVGTSLVAPPQATSGKWLLPRPSMHYEVVGKSFPAGQGSSRQPSNHSVMQHVFRPRQSMIIPSGLLSQSLSRPGPGPSVQLLDASSGTTDAWLQLPLNCWSSNLLSLRQHQSW